MCSEFESWFHRVHVETLDKALYMPTKAVTDIFFQNAEVKRLFKWLLLRNVPFGAERSTLVVIAGNLCKMLKNFWWIGCYTKKEKTFFSWIIKITNSRLGENGQTNVGPSLDSNPRAIVYGLFKVFAT